MIITNKVINSSEVREKILAGVEKVANAVTSTLGPGGRNVMIQQIGGMPPIVTKDGVSVARSIHLSDNYEDMGAQMVIEVASKTNTSCGDGTTTATLLAYEMYKNAKHVVDTYGVEPMDAQRGMLDALDRVKDFVKKSVVTISDDDEAILNVARISANGDNEIGNMVSSIIKETGKDGIVVVQEGNNLETTWSATKGMRLDSGWMSHYFCNEIKGQPLCIFENAYVLFYENKMSNINELYPILSKVMKTGKPIVIVAEDFDKDVLQTLVTNRLSQRIQVCAVKAPGVQDYIRRDNMGDAAVATGAKFIDRDIGINLQDVELQHLGIAKRVEITFNSCTFIDGNANPEVFEKRVEELKHNLADNSITPYQKGIMKNRLARLVGGVGVVNVGGETRAIIHEKRDRIDDALCATREAVSGGIVAGGGSTLLKAGLMLTGCEFVTEHKMQPNEVMPPVGSSSYIPYIGDMIVGPALQAPFRKLLSNAGYLNDTVLARLDEGITTDNLSPANRFGYDVRNKTFCDDMIASGIVDPANVTLSAVSNAISVAALLISTDCMVGIESITDDSIPQGM